MDTEKKFSTIFKESYENLIQAVNDAHANGIPHYMLELMLTNILTQVQIGAREEYASDVEDTPKGESDE